MAERSPTHWRGLADHKGAGRLLQKRSRQPRWFRVDGIGLLGFGVGVVADTIRV